MSEETKPADTTAIAKKPAPPLALSDDGFQLKTLDDAWRFANYVLASGMAPKGYAKPESVIIAIQRGAELGLPPLQAIDSIAVINGRATVWGDAIPGLLWGSGLLEDINEYFETVSGGEMVAVCRMKRKGAATPIEATFSVSDAKTAGLWGKAGPWTQYPKRMLKMRARTWCARDGFADVLRGLQIREEVQDYHEPPQARQTVTLTADGRLETEPLPTLPAPSEDVVDADAEPIVNGKGELF